MGKNAAIVAATKAQLAADSKPEVVTGQETMAGTFGYDGFTMPQYLAAVALKLAPAYTCDVASLDVNTSLNDTYDELCQDISGATK